jgi:hypothetical protein
LPRPASRSSAEREPPDRAFRALHEMLSIFPRAIDGERDVLLQMPAGTAPHLPNYTRPFST